LDWPIYATVEILFIGDKKYRKNILIAITSIIICFLLIMILWNQAEGVPIQSLFPTITILTAAWWIAAYLIGDFVQKLKDGTLFDKQYQIKS